MQDADLNDKRTDNDEPTQTGTGRVTRALRRGRHAARRAGRHAARRARDVARRGRHFGLGAAALAIAGLSAVGGSAPGGLVPEPTDTSAVTQSVIDRSTQERADRSARTAPDASPSASEPATAAATPSTPPSSAPPSSPPPASPEPKPTPKPDWVSPMPGAQVTSCYGPRWGTLHAGIDLALPPGTPVLAVGAGTVEAAGWLYAGYGISVVINHGNGYLTHYAHLSKATVSPGQRVSAGQQIGAEGSTGDSTGPHLHFEVHRGMWNQIEPAKWLRDRGVHIPGC
ncbi:MAG: M23 family metallopeptidase [Micromonosporaceae bacterium]